MGHKFFKRSEETRARDRQYKVNAKLKDPVGYLYNAKVSQCKYKGCACTFALRPEWRDLICRCCGKLCRPSRGKRTDDSPSFDCIDPTLGYIEGNVQFVCWGCNFLKKAGVLLQFVQLSEYILRYLPKSDTLSFRPARAR